LLVPSCPTRRSSDLRWSYPVLDPVSRAYPEIRGRLLTCYSPVRHSSTPSKLRASAFDLHVLSTQPAFVLSQDQTLHKKIMLQNESQQDSQPDHRSEEHTSELQSRFDLVCRLLLEKKNKK